MNHPASTAGEVVQRAPTRAIVSWMGFDWSVQPFYTLVQTFLFAPYFATVVVADATTGQAVWAYAAAFAGAIVAIGSPVLGALADGGGRRKLWIFLFGLVFIAGTSTLWLATPGLSGNLFWLVLLGYAAAFAGAEFAAVFVNSIMPTLAPKNELGRISGIGWGLGYAGGLVSLVLVAVFIVIDPATNKTLAGYEPVWRLDAALRESDRIIGPLAAAWFVIFVMPFFLFVPDTRAALRAPTATPVRDALQRLWGTIRELPQHRSILFLLLARLLYSDGLAAIFLFGGIYGKAIFGWGQFELGLFGIIATLAGVIGAVVGGFIDDRRGAKVVIMGALIIMIVGVAGILSVDKTHVLFVLDTPEKQPGSPLFSTLGEQVFLAFTVMVGLCAAPVQAAGRSLLARLAPAEKMTQFFGLFAFSGKATAFLAPLLIGIITQLTGSQRLGVAVTGVFLLIGLILMIPVREPRRS